MTEAQTGEPTPKEYNQQLRSIFDQIPRESVQLEYDLSFISGMAILTRAITSGDLPKGQKRHISLGEIFSAESLEKRQLEDQERRMSPELSALRSKLEQLLTTHSSITEPAVTATILQFADDYAEGRRAEDPIGNATTVRFPASVLLDMGNPDSEGVFSQNIDKVRQLERTLYGCYLDWAEIGDAGGNETASGELDLLHQWRIAFIEKYGEAPFPNLEPQSPEISSAG